MYDVLIIGGGIAGSYLAFKLSSLGLKVLLLEQKKNANGKECCTGLIGYECAKLYPFDDSLVIRKFNRATLYSPSKKKLLFQRNNTQALVIDRSKFDTFLINLARDKGAHFYSGNKVEEIEVNDHKVMVGVDYNSHFLNFEAKVGIIANGYNSKLTEKLGLGCISNIALGAQTEIESLNHEEVEIFFGRNIAPGFFGWLVPTRPNQAKVGVLTRNNPGIYLDNLLSMLTKMGKVKNAKGKYHLGGIPLTTLTQSYSNRILVVGDAAGQVKPTTGGGIFYSLICSDIAMETLKGAFEVNNFSSQYLSQYEKKWKETLGREIKIGYLARKIFESFNDQMIDLAFELVKRSGLLEVLLKNEEFSFDWHSKPIINILKNNQVAKLIGINNYLKDEDDI
ncbi:MAG: D-amino acid dehydrogenase [candidate division WS2 bacterium]|nr:D-amino acid dehydrogenase [Candidatus Lithacetigena glycinireducens]